MRNYCSVYLPFDCGLDMYSASAHIVPMYFREGSVWWLLFPSSFHLALLRHLTRPHPQLPRADDGGLW